MIRLALAFMLVASAVTAQSVKLSGAEVGALLTGNTAVGAWEGAQYRQYFDPDGTTIYAQEGSRSALGQWRVQDDAFQSLWPSDDDWQAWLVMEFAGDWFWVNKATPPTPFAIEQGLQLDAE